MCYPAYFGKFNVRCDIIYIYKYSNLRATIAIAVIRLYNTHFRLILEVKRNLRVEAYERSTRRKKEAWRQNFISFYFFCSGKVCTIRYKANGCFSFLCIIYYTTLLFNEAGTILKFKARKKQYNITFTRYIKKR